MRAHFGRSGAMPASRARRLDHAHPINRVSLPPSGHLIRFDADHLTTITQVAARDLPVADQTTRLRLAHQSDLRWPEALTIAAVFPEIIVRKVLRQRMRAVRARDVSGGLHRRQGRFVCGAIDANEMFLALG